MILLGLFRPYVRIWSEGMQWRRSRLRHEEEEEEEQEQEEEEEEEEGWTGR